MVEDYELEVLLSLDDFEFQFAGGHLSRVQEVRDDMEEFGGGVFHDPDHLFLLVVEGAGHLFAHLIPTLGSLPGTFLVPAAAYAASLVSPQAERYLVEAPPHDLF